MSVSPALESQNPCPVRTMPGGLPVQRPGCGAPYHFHVAAGDVVSAHELSGPSRIGLHRDSNGTCASSYRSRRTALPDPRDRGGLVSAFRPTYGMELLPILRQLVDHGETKVLAARMGVSADWLGRVLRGALPLPAATLPALVLALGAERGERLLHAVLDPLGIVFHAAPVADGNARAGSAHVEFDRRSAAFEDAMERQAPMAEVRASASRLLGFVTWWLAAHEAERRQQAGRRAA